MKLTNAQMSNYIIALNNIAPKITGKFAYIVAKNIRKISQEIIEYEKVKNELIVKYGDKDDSGNFRIKIGTTAYDKFMDEISQYSSIESEIPIIMINSEEIYKSQLTANEILSIDFMIEDDE